jgi:signal transduction histidine kinase
MKWLERAMPRTLFMRLAVLWCAILLLTHFAQRGLYYTGLGKSYHYWPFALFVFQLIAAMALSWLAARQATRPLSELADATEEFGGNQPFAPIAEAGPYEVARAAAAFNRMGRRIEEHLNERVRILAAISHDLQTPITRLRLRAELLDDGAGRDKWLADLASMETLVAEGLAYARSKDRVSEQARLVDLHALLDNVICDYADEGKAVTLAGDETLRIVTRPNALRRVLINLVDNALKFGGSAEVTLQRVAGGVCLEVSDRGPGIPPDMLEAVFDPFFRVERSRNRDSGGTGLGLSIARELSASLPGTLTLANRVGGGLVASLLLPA